MRLTFDFETRSPVDIKKRGVWVYAEHPDTSVICLAVKEDDAPARIWVAPYFLRILGELAEGLPLISRGEMLALIDRADEIEAHHAAFERAIWRYVMVRDHGAPPLPLQKLRCSMAKACMHSLPRSLDELCRVLGLPGKDKEGQAALMRVCRPRKPRKADRLAAIEAGQDPDSLLLWNEDPRDLFLVCRYCCTDVDIERAASAQMRDLPPVEQKIWHLDQEINEAGIRVDTQACARIIEEVKIHEERLLARFRHLTNGVVRSPKQVEAFRGLLKTLGVHLPDLAKTTVAAAMQGLEMDDDGFVIPESGLPEKARALLEIRRSLSKSSVAKYNAFLARTSSDGQYRGALVYHGAGTGRWAGTGVQLHNLPRGSFKDVEECVSAFCAQGLDVVELLWGDPMVAASTCLRPMLIAPDGHDFLCADFSSIEARVLCWMAESEPLLDVFRSGRDNYKVAASGIYNVPYGEVTKDQRQIGKVAELACGYQGHVGAFQAMAKVYGVKVEDEKAAEIVNAWREKRPEIVSMWYALEDAAIRAVKNPGRVFGYKKIGFKSNGRFLMMKLPSGRLLFYYKPSIEMRTTKFGKEKESVCFWGVDSMTKKWSRQHTYGGKLTENADQAISRDLLAYAMLRARSRGYGIALHVHDEIVGLAREGEGDLKEFETIMAQTPKWAEGCPVKAEGWRGKRYRK